MRILSFDYKTGLHELKKVLHELLGDALEFRGFNSVKRLLKAAEKQGYDMVFAEIAFQQKSGLLLLSELSFRYPKTKYVAVAAEMNDGDALTMHRLHGGYIIKPYDREILADMLRHLRFPANETV